MCFWSIEGHTPTWWLYKDYTNKTQQNKRRWGDYSLEGLKRIMVKKEEIKEHRQELAGRQHRDVHPECTLHSACGAGMSKMTKAGQVQSNVRAMLKNILVLANRERCHICVCMVGSASRVPCRNLLHAAWAYVGSCNNRFTCFELLREDL